MRVYEFSKKNNKASKDVIVVLKAAGFEVGNHMSVLSDDAIRHLEKHFNILGGKRVETQDTTLENISTGNKGAALSQGKAKPSGPVLTLEPTLLGDFADAAGIPASSLILFLLKQGAACNRNQLLTKEQVGSVAEQFEIELSAPKDRGVGAIGDTVVGNKNRLPVVVVVGHVDHGKTTLLDFIRKTRVVAREKGGITQHLGAYRVDGKGGAVVFLDTPGHEAFVSIRKRGLKVADIAVLIIAADDGIMPQTVEAIKQAKEAGLPVVVAINKIDKANDAQVEKIKTQLSQHGMTPEEWGGETVLIKVSAKEGTGVDELIDMIALQAEMMELRTNLDIDACGYILESKMEKGRGPVATFIAQHGHLSQGSFFACGDTAGKVVSLKDCNGKSISEAGPSVPVSISGFDSLPRAGDYLRVITEAEYRKIKSSSPQERPSSAYLQSEIAAGDINTRIFIKSDTASSDEAVVGAVRKLAKATSEGILIVGSGVGDINEGDIGYADSIGAMVYGFGVRISPGAMSLAKSLKVRVNLFNIIYKLVDHLAEVVEKNKVIVVVKNKIGEVEVLKVFNIKNVGVIAGVQVKKGKIIKGCEGVILRHGEKVGGGSIGSLQRDRKSVKEIAAGYEGAFIIQGFVDWQEGDIVECFVEE